MILTVTQFDTYSGNYEASEAVIAMKTSILKSAQEIVSNYIGFDPESAQRDDWISAIGNNRLYLLAHPVTQVTSVELNGVEVPQTAYSVHDRYLRLNNGVWPEGLENVKVVYTAGWSSENLPETIKLVILQIATLMLMEAGENIGVTGKSFGENSRTFINYTNMNKWLSKLDEYKIVRLV